MKMNEVIDLIKKDLAENYHDSDDDVLEAMFDYYISIASDASNRKTDDKKLIPYVYTAVKSAYLRRGDEGTTSSSEGGLNSSYIDIEDKLKNDIRSIRLLI